MKMSIIITDKGIFKGTIEDLKLFGKISMKQPKLYDVVCTVDDLCYMDYYNGHGHAFEDETLIGCMVFSPYVNTRMTNQDIEDEVIREINASEPDILNPQYDELVRHIPDQELRDAFKDEVKGEPKDKPFKGMNLGPDCQLIGYFHIYLKGDSE